MHDVLTLWTIGHGNRPINELIAMLTEAGIATLVDVRAQPHSARHPQFNEESLRASCGQANVVYHWAGRHLGGKRALQFNSPHSALDEGRRGFADHMGTEIFRRAVSQVVNLAARGPTALLCAERDPQQCHRALIADYLVLQGLRVVHLMASGASHEHLLSPQARRESAALIYDRQATAELDLGGPG
ncbi:MAG TPA: DUF488 domain-containing protein [Acidiferrobacterales bacterium]|nr:DUF488 domain-containing protein [Acidiferrobacterales bacterium]